MDAQHRDCGGCQLAYLHLSLGLQPLAMCLTRSSFSRGTSWRADIAGALANRRVDWLALEGKGKGQQPLIRTLRGVGYVLKDR